MSSHPALSFAARARVRTAPRSRHVEIEAGELARVIAGLDLDELHELSHEQRIAAVTFALGRALRCPVVLRAGANDAKGRAAPGNSGSQLLAALAGRSQPYTAETMRLAIVAGHERGILARASRVQRGSWQDAKGRQWASKFLRGLIYLPGSVWQELYHERAFPRLASQLGRAAPRAWCAAARLRRREGGLWASIRPTPTRPERREADVPFRTILQALRDGQPWRSIVAKHPGLSYDRIRHVFKAWTSKFGIYKTKRNLSSIGVAAPVSAKIDPAPKKALVAPESLPRAAGRGGAETESLAQGSFRDRMARLLGSEHALIRGARSS